MISCPCHRNICHVRRALRRADAQRKLTQQRALSEEGGGSEADYGPLYSPQPRSPAWAHGSEADKVSHQGSTAHAFSKEQQVPESAKLLSLAAQSVAFRWHRCRL